MTRSLHTLIQYLRHHLPPHGDAALSDAHLLERWINQHDPAAFELMLWRHGPMVLNTCRRLLPRCEDIEDAFQATFLVLVRKAGSIRRREALAAWLHRIACRIAGRARETNRLRTRREQPIADTVAALDVDAPALRDLHAILDEEIESLPSHYRRALILCCLEGKSQEEAAKLLNRPRGTVSSWLTRGRERLRQRLLRRGIVVSTAALTTALTPDALSSGGMIPLIGSLVRMAGAVAAGGALPAGLMTARSIVLAQGVLRMMFMTKVKIVTAMSLAVVVATAGVGTWSHTTRADDVPDHKAPAKKVEQRFSGTFKFYKEAPLVSPKDALEKDGIAWGEKAHGLQAGIAFRRGDQERYEIGQSVTFVVYLRNVSDKKITLSHSEPLFDEQMPNVADAEGRRLAVAHGPIHLGVVPMTQRSLEAGRQIVLGYPWFRIRPLDWRGDVQGPTCCAESGRYKVGYTGLPLRLSDGKDISLGTKQVDLVIGKREAAKEERAEAKTPSVEMPAIPALENEEKARLYYINSHFLTLPLKIDQEKIQEVNLLISRDKGRTWRFVARNSSAKLSVGLKVPEDGVYWLLAQTLDKQGRCVPADPSQAKPSMRICVDTTAPKATLFRPVVVNRNTIHLGWKAEDANLEERPVKLEWAEHKDGPWCHIVESPNTGIYRWHLSDRMPSEVYLRICVRDKAGNEACAMTDKPISIINRENAKEGRNDEEALMGDKEQAESALRVADNYFKREQYERALQKYEEIATKWENKLPGLRALGGTIRCFGALGADKERRQQRVKEIRDRLPTIVDLTEVEHQQWRKWLDMVEDRRGE